MDGAAAAGERWELRSVGGGQSGDRRVHLDRRIAAYDAGTGEPLWQTRLNEVPSAAPITYGANGRQYVAVIVGSGGYQSGSYGVMVPEIKNPPDRGAALWVFELK